MIFSQLPQLLLAVECTGQSLIPDLFGGGLRDESTCEVKIDQLNDVLVLVANVISILMLVAGAVAITFIIIGGFTYITSSGDSAGIKKAKDTIVNAIIGLVLAMVAFGVVKFITGSF
jgi:hypothetical protein